MVNQSRNKNFVVYRGDTLSFNLQINSAGAAQDITDWTFFLTVKSAIDDDSADSAALIAIEVTSHTDAESGQTLIEATAAQCNALSGEYFYDLQCKTDAGKIYTLLYGKLTFDEDVTRRTA